jgi:ABC-2 type transport system ATP-binding protein
MADHAPAVALRVRNLRKTYKDVVAVNGLDLEVRTGECFGVLGPNGAGKTTTVEICEGLTQPDSGEFEVLGMQWRTHADELRHRLGIQLQETQLSEKLSVEGRSACSAASSGRVWVRPRRSRWCSWKKSATRV